MTYHVWPDLPGAEVTVTELGRTEYTLFADGTESFAEWERREDGEMHLLDAEVREVAPEDSLAAAIFGPDILAAAIEATKRNSGDA